MGLGILIAFLATNLWAAPKSLEETGLYSDISKKTLAEDVREFLPQYPLWSDGLKKSRWIQLPGKIDTTNANAWVFPVGTKLWKEFRLGEKRIETRLIEKTGDGYEFSTYLWNDEQTKADRATNAGIRDYVEISPGVTHDIPSRLDCLRCHKNEGDPVLGFSALQLSSDRDPLAPHAEPFTAGLLNLCELQAKQLVSKPLKMVPRIRAKTPEGRATMGYLHANCGSCHRPGGSAFHTDQPMWHEVETTDPVKEVAFVANVNRLALTFFIPDAEETYRIRGKHPEQSAVLYRMEKPPGFERMPPLGTKRVDTVATQLMRKWIGVLSDSVNLDPAFGH